jgi:hypothetical protein
MTWGPGKYDHLLTQIRLKTKCDAACLVVVGGTRGTGFDCQMRVRGQSGAENAAFMRDLAKALRETAYRLDADAMDAETGHIPEGGVHLEPKNRQDPS